MATFLLSLYNAAASAAARDPLGINAALSKLPLPSVSVSVHATDASVTPEEAWLNTLPIITWATAATAVTGLLLLWRTNAALDSKHNNPGILAYSNFFYTESLQFLNAAPFLLNFAPTLVALAGAHYGGAYTFGVFVVGFIIVPFVELIVGEDSYNPTPEEEKALKKNIWFRVLTWLYVPVHIASILYTAKHIYDHPELTTFELVGITTSVGIAGGFGIGCVHELIHRPTVFELGLGIADLVFAWYGHFWIEHLWGHHKRVATDEDPASSALGETVYDFLPKCLYQSFIDACEIEAKYAKKKGYWFWGPQNRILLAQAASAVVTYGVYNHFGAVATYYFLGQGLVSNVLLENVNYIEHYGLRRRKLEGRDRDGEQNYERPGWFHAWNTGDRITNWLLFKIERHPDHHTNAGRPYQILRTFKESPTYPTGYAGMVLLSWFPPLFFAVMDPLVAKAYRDREEMERKGVNYFPGGSNNMSSVYKREGEGFFEPGSSPYEESDFYGKDRDTERTVYETQFEEDTYGESKDD